MGGAGFVSNLILWRESGYFDSLADTKPLLHLWSLGVEEQFYIIWPLILWFSWKKKLNFLSITLIIAGISFGLSLYKVRTDPVAAFYCPQTRFWELMLGSLLAYTQIHQHSWVNKLKQTFTKYFFMITRLSIPEKNEQIYYNLKSFIGVILIVCGLFFTTKENLFPGSWALLPTVGVILIISAGKKAWFNEVFLSHPICVWFGLISYPLYLWHWPLLSFARIVEGHTPVIEIRLISILASVFLAWSTFRFIEKPLRFSKHKFTATVLFVALLILGFVGFLAFELNNQSRSPTFGLTIAKKLAYITSSIYDRSKKDVPSIKVKTARFDPIKGKVLNGDIGFKAVDQYVDEHDFRCHSVAAGPTIEGNVFIGIGCLESQKDRKPDLVILGDSHAGHLFVGLAEELKNKNILTINIYGQDGLPYVTNKKFAGVFSYLINSKSIKTVIISNLWINPGQNLSSAEGLKMTVDALSKSGKTVYITDDVPTFSFDPANCKFSRKFSSGRQCSESSEVFLKYYNSYMTDLNQLTQLGPKVIIANTASIFCNDKKCSMSKDGSLMFADRSHLNMQGSIYVAKALVTQHPALKY